MNQNRKNIIIKEILYWKSSKLLPEHYCDFLLSLYTEGNQEMIEQKEKKATILYNVLLIFVALLVPISFLFIYFTELPIVLQTGMLSFFICLCFVVLLLLKKKLYRFYVHIILVVIAILFFFIQVELCTYFSANNQWAIAGVIFINCLGWIVIGKTRKLTSFFISGIVGMIIFIILLGNLIVKNNFLFY